MRTPAATPLEALVAALDETALTAHASRGLFIRASRDVEAGKVAIRTRGTDTATIAVEEVTVELSARGLKASRCTCPAVGVCRHMLAAVLALHAAPAPGDTAPGVSEAAIPQPAPVPARPAESPPDRALAAVLLADPVSPVEFDLDALRAFAGAQWPQAVALAATSVDIRRDGSPSVRFGETGDRVVFPWGLGLAGAVHKGKPSRRRVAVVAAALVLRQDSGAPLPEVLNATGPAGVTPELLDRVVDALCAAATLLAAGSPRSACGRLFSVAIMARTEDAPQLASQLRALARRLDTDASDDIAERPGQRLAALAETYALAEAIRANPTDPLLTGVLARSYVRGDARDVALIGAEHWRTPAGARGMTLVFADVATGRLHRAVEARGPGIDLAFSETEVYRQPLWRLATPAQLMGSTLTLPEAAIAPDGALGLNQSARPGAGPFDIRTLLGRGSAVSAWSDLDRILRESRGLRRGVAEPMAVLFPTHVAAPDFDAHDQTWRWDWRDAGDVALTLYFPAHIADDPAALRRHSSNILAGLVALRPGADGPRPCLLSLWVKSNATRPFPLQLDFPRAPAGWRAIADLMKRRMSARPPPVRSIDPLRRFLDRMLEAVADEAGARHAPVTASLRPEATTLGLTRLERLISTFVATPTPTHAFRLAYALSVTREALD